MIKLKYTYRLNMKNNEDLTISNNDIDKRNSVNIDISTKIPKRYKIIEEIGQGGMGLIYKAYDKRLKKNVAIKFIKSPLKQSIKEIEKEAIKIAQVEHQNVCQIYDFVIEKDISFIIMQYIEGESLYKKIIDHKLSFEESVDIATQICNGMEAIHAKGIIHRDLKPSNILITNDNIAKIIDFGVSKFIKNPFEDENDDTINSLIYSRTKDFEVKGTINYMAPEILNGEPIDERTDIYSFGLILYEMFSFEKVFDTNTLATIINNILNKDIPKIKLNKKDISERINNIIQKATNKDKTKRYNNFNALKKELIKLKELNIKKVHVKKNLLSKIFNLRKIIKYSFISIILIYLSLSFYSMIATRLVEKSNILTYNIINNKFHINKLNPNVEDLITYNSNLFLKEKKGNTITIYKYNSIYSIINKKKFIKKIIIKPKKIDQNKVISNNLSYINNKFYLYGSKAFDNNIFHSYIECINQDGKREWELYPSKRDITSSVISLKKISNDLILFLLIYDDKELGISFSLNLINEKGEILKTKTFNNLKKNIYFPEIVILKDEMILLKYITIINNKGNINLNILNKNLDIIKTKEISTNKELAKYSKIITNNSLQNILLGYLNKDFSLKGEKKLFLTLFDKNLNIIWQRIINNKVKMFHLSTSKNNYLILYSNKALVFLPFISNISRNYLITIDEEGRLLSMKKLKRVSYFNKFEYINKIFNYSSYQILIQMTSLSLF